MDPGDQVILSYEDYTRFKQLDNENKALAEKIKEINKQKQNLSYKIQLTEEKLINKNGEVVKQQLRNQYLLSLLNELKKVFNIKGQAIGEGFKQMMDESIRFSVLKVEEKNIDEELPSNFSKTTQYLKIDAEFQSQKTLIQYCSQEWNEKNKAIQYLEKQLKGQGKSKEIAGNNTHNQKEKQHRALQQKYEELLRKHQSLQLDMKQKIQFSSKTSAKQSNEHLLAIKAQSQNLKSQNRSLRSQLSQIITFNKQTQQASNTRIKTLQQTIIKLQNQLSTLHKHNQQLKSANSNNYSSSQSFNTDVKSKIISMITQYTIELKKSYTEIGLTTNQKKQLIKSEISQIQRIIKKQLDKIL